MESEILKQFELFLSKAHTALKETQVLYELGEAEQLIFAQFMIQLPIKELSPKLAVKFLKAAAHFLDTLDDDAHIIFGTKLGDK